MASEATLVQPNVHEPKKRCKHSALLLKQQLPASVKGKSNSSLSLSGKNSERVCCNSFDKKSLGPLETTGWLEPYG